MDYNPYEGRDEREKLDGVITKNIVDSIKDRLYNVDFENKVMRGVNVEAVRSVVGRDDFSNFFRPSQLTEALSPIKSFRLSEEYTDSSLLFDNLDHGTMGAPHFSGYEISFDDRDYDFDRQAAKDMREFCDYESKESETTVSRKLLHVPEVAEDDKDLEY